MRVVSLAPAMPAIATSPAIWRTVPATAPKARRPGAGLLGSVFIGAAAAVCLWGVGTLAVTTILRPTAPAGDAAPARLALSLPTTPLTLNKPPVRPDRFARLPEIPDVVRPGLSAEAIVAARARHAESALAESWNSVLDRAVAAASSTIADVGPRYLSFAAGALSPRIETPTAPILPAAPSVEVATLTPPEAEVVPPLPTARPAQPAAQSATKPANRQAERQPADRPPVVAAPKPREPREVPTAPVVASNLRRPGVAIYDISAGQVYMPDGSRLEAHSGIGSMRDNPRFVHIKMRGATPPSTYKLSLRESLFHGVRAIRLTPVDGNNPHGRVGLLAHTYMLRIPGDSNGCVVFRNYDRFLQAFLRGDIRQMVVVTSIGARTQQIAAIGDDGR